MRHFTAFLGSMALLVLRSQADFLPGYMGCYTDDLKAHLSYPVSAPENVEGCQASCLAAGYLYAGLQQTSSDQCLCGNDISQIAWVGEVKCSYPCKGNYGENCGGAAAKSVYRTSMPNNFVGCYQDDSSNPDFGSYPLYSSPGGMSTDNCASHCGFQRYQYFAVQNGTDCRCSNTPPTYTQVVGRECNKVCTVSHWEAGAYPHESCGGESRNSFYRRPHHQYGWQGCYRDDGNRVLPDYVSDLYGQNSASVLGCFATCIQRTHWMNRPVNPYMNETYSGVEYGGECYCGDGTKMNTGKYYPIDEMYCGMPCGNNPSQPCGGSWAIGIWYTRVNFSDL